MGLRMFLKELQEQKGCSFYLFVSSIEKHMQNSVEEGYLGHQVLEMVQSRILGYQIKFSHGREELQMSPEGCFLELYWFCESPD